ncbi:MAG: hypothetical protein WCV81_05020 [Microgenomates group bacterium]|jgi:hypothetical protein
MAKEQKLETQQDYWKAIEGLGGFVWQLNHDLADGRIEDPQGTTSKGIFDMQQRLEGIVAELCDKYNIISPKESTRVDFYTPLPPAPVGKTYYWEWYKEQKTSYYTQRYNELICSSCPIARDIESYLSGGYSDPCTKYIGNIYNGRTPKYECAMTILGDWSRDWLERNISAEGGPEALEKFVAKETELKSQYPQEAQ